MATPKKRKKRKTRAKAAGRNAAPPAERAIDAALLLAAEKGWGRVAMTAVAARAGLAPAELLALFPDKQSLLAGFFRRVDAKVLAGGVYGPGATEPARDRLFDLLMRRFDALAPRKKAVAAIAGATACDPAMALCGLCRLKRSLALMLEAAGIDSSGLVGLARVKGLVVVYLCAFQAWLKDDTADMAKTMAALDRGLKRAEALARLCAWRPAAKPRSKTA